MAKGKKDGRAEGWYKEHISVDIRYLVQSYANTAIGVLFGLMFNSKQDVVKISADSELLDGAYGKPSPIEPPKAEDEEAVPVLVEVEVIDARKVDG